MQRSDGTYGLPDEKVSRVWQHEGGAILSAIRKSDESLAFWENRGNPITPQPGRWLPWTQPVFPVRKKCELRLCIVTYRSGQQHITNATWFANEAAAKRACFFTPLMAWIHDSEVVSVQWLTPEYEDELGAQQ